jgi:predicted metal-dependent peptidase
MIKNIHEKLLNTVQIMLVDCRHGLPYYGEFNLHISFHEQENIGTCAVNVGPKGMNFFYNSKFLEDLTQKEVNFIDIHEIFHLLFDHPKRTTSGLYNHKLSNIAQDMIINHVIWEDINHDFVEIPKSKDGKNMALFLPKEYDGKLIFEELYEWLRDEKEKWDKKQDNSCTTECKSCNGTGKKQDLDKNKEKGEDKGNDGDQNDGGQEECSDCNGNGLDQENDSTGKPSYGPYGKNPKNAKDSLDTWSKEKIFQDLEEGNGEYMDKHIGDTVPSEMREGIVKDLMDKLQARGLSNGNIESIVDKLRKKRKDYLREIKRAISSTIFGTIKEKSITRPNRKQISGVKGFRKIKTKINVILDVSGSMHGLIEKVLNYVYQNDIEINLIQADTQVNKVDTLKSGKKLETIKLVGFGGTVLQPAIDYVVENFNKYNTVILTDGFCDTLDLAKLKGKSLVITAGTKVPISRIGKSKQIFVDNEFK